MAGEQQLRDARITLTIDTTAAEKRLDDIDDGSTPGGRPPQPGRDRGKDRRRDDDRDRRPGRRPGPGAAVGVAAIPGRAVIAAVKTFAAAYMLKIVSETLPGMVDRRMATLDKPVRFAAEATGLPSLARGVFGGIAAGFHGLEIAAATVAPAVRTARDLGRSQMLLTGRTDEAGIADVTLREMKIAGALSSIAALKREQGRRFMGAAAVDISDNLKDRLFGGTTR